MVTGTGISLQNSLQEGKRSVSVSPSSPKKSAPTTDVTKYMEKTTEDLQKNMEEVRQTISEMEKITESQGKKLNFKVNEELGEVVVKVIDPSTDKVIKEIPSTELQQLQVQIKKTIGMIFDETI